MRKEYVSLTLTTGVTVLCEIDSKPDANGFYVIHNPVKPIAIQDGTESRIALVQMNPFSDSSEFRIHHSHIVSVGSMIADYIEKYIDSVRQIDLAIEKRYREMLIPSNPSKEYLEEITSKSLQ